MAAVLAGGWNGGVDQTALNELAPFLVVEEEGALTIFVVDFAKGNRATNVEAVGIQTKFRRCFSGGFGECVRRIKSIVAVEFPQPAVETAVAGLDESVMVAEDESPYSAP